jgi:hypothetical protein
MWTGDLAKRPDPVIDLLGEPSTGEAVGTSGIVTVKRSEF